MNKCKCCNKTISVSPLFILNNMPHSAQGFLNENELSADSGVNIELYQCPFCGLVQLFCEPVSYYKQVIRATRVSDEMRVFRKQQFEQFKEEFNLNDKKIIEIGCGRGDYLEIWNEFADVQVFGTEYDEASVNYCIDNSLNVQKGYLDSADTVLQGAPFDAFYILNFLEHIPNPSVFLSAIAANLKEDAYGLVEVPNCNMIFSENLYSELIPDHLMYFTEDTLRNTLSINGFEVIRCESIWYDYILSAVVKKKKLFDGNGFRNNYEYMNNMVSSFFKEQSKEGEIAVWGAGHQALANMGVLDISQYISYVIDSAPFKQNKYTPVSHIPIVSSDILNTGRIKLVVIMAGSYSDEIAKIMKTNFEGIKTVILRQSSLEEVK